MEDYDLIVVGAGPGGSVAAMTAAEQGMKVLMLERSNYPGEKNASGFALSSKGERDFPFLKEVEFPSMRIGRRTQAHFLSPPPEMEERFSMVTTTSRRISYPEGRDYFVKTMYRPELDRYLAERAVEKGAELRLKVLVNGLIWETGKVAGVRVEGGEEYRAPVVIGADGVMSMTARMAGLREKFGRDEVVSLCTVDYAVPRERADAVIHENCFQTYFAPGFGGLYLIVMADGVHVGGPGVTNSLVSRAVRKRINPAREVLQMINCAPIQRQLTALDAKPREWQAHMLPWMDRFNRRIYTGGFMLVGDAAGVPEPLWAEGVWQAMYSGRLAAQVALEALEEKDVSASSLERYCDRLEESPVGQEFIAGVQLRQLFEMLGDPVIFDEAIDALVDLSNNMLWNCQEPKAVSINRLFPILLENLPLLFGVLRVYAPVLLETGGDSLRKRIETIKGLSAMISQMTGGEVEK